MAILTPVLFTSPSIEEPASKESKTLSNIRAELTMINGDQGLYLAQILIRIFKDFRRGRSH